MEVPAHKLDDASSFLPLLVTNHWETMSSPVKNEADTNKSALSATGAAAETKNELETAADDDNNEDKDYSSLSDQSNLDDNDDDDDDKHGSDLAQGNTRSFADTGDDIVSVAQTEEDSLFSADPKAGSQDISNNISTEQNNIVLSPSSSDAPTKLGDETKSGTIVLDLSEKDVLFGINSNARKQLNGRVLPGNDVLSSFLDDQLKEYQPHNSHELCLHTFQTLSERGVRFLDCIFDKEGKLLFRVAGKSRVVQKLSQKLSSRLAAKLHRLGEANQGKDHPQTNDHEATNEEVNPEELTSTTDLQAPKKNRGGRPKMVRLEELTEKDVVLGRSREARMLLGNQRYRQLTKAHSDDFFQSKDKTSFVKEFIKSHQFRFLQKGENSESLEFIHPVRNDDKIFDKVRQVLYKLSSKKKKRAQGEKDAVSDTPKGRKRAKTKYDSDTESYTPRGQKRAKTKSDHSPCNGDSKANKADVEQSKGRLDGSTRLPINTRVGCRWKESDVFYTGLVKNVKTAHSGDIEHRVVYEYDDTSYWVNFEEIESYITPKDKFPGKEIEERNLLKQTGPTESIATVSGTSFNTTNTLPGKEIEERSLLNETGPTESIATVGGTSFNTTNSADEGDDLLKHSSILLERIDKLIAGQQRDLAREKNDDFIPLHETLFQSLFTELGNAEPKDALCFIQAIRRKGVGNERNRKVMELIIADCSSIFLIVRVLRLSGAQDTDVALQGLALLMELELLNISKFYWAFAHVLNGVGTIVDLMTSCLQDSSRPESEHETLILSAGMQLLYRVICADVQCASYTVSSGVLEVVAKSMSRLEKDGLIQRLGCRLFSKLLEHDASWARKIRDAKGMSVVARVMESFTGRVAREADHTYNELRKGIRELLSE